MKHNRSLKDIFIPKSNFKDREDSASGWSPRNFQPENTGYQTARTDQKTLKNTQSQKNILTINPLNTSIASPKYIINQPSNVTNVLTPANKNISNQ